MKDDEIEHKYPRVSWIYLKTKEQIEEIIRESFPKEEIQEMSQLKYLGGH